jgi:hypothetical protein
VVAEFLKSAHGQFDHRMLGYVIGLLALLQLFNVAKLVEA